MVKRVWHVVSICALVTAAGCGDDAGTDPEGSISVVASPTSLSLTQGQSGTVTVTLTRGGGFAGPVDVSVEGLPSGVTASVSPTQLTGTTTQAVVTVNVANSVAAGTYTATIRASATGLPAATVQYSLTVDAIPDFALSASPASLTIAAGTSGTTSVSISRTNLSSTVSLSLIPPHMGITAVFNPAAPTTNSSAVTINVASDVPPGSYTLTIRGNAPNVTNERTTNVFVTVVPAPNFTLNAVPNVLSAVTAGTSNAATVSIVRANFTADVALSLLNAPAGITGTFTPGTLSGTTLASSLAINVAGSVAPGTYLLTVQAVGGSLTRTTPVALAVAAQSVGFSTTPSLVSIQRGATGTATLNVARTGFAAGITPAVSGNPPGMTVTFAPNPITDNAAQITVTVGPSVIAGTYNLVIDASGVPGNPSTTLVVIVTATGGGGSNSIVWEFCNNEPLPIMFWRKSNGSWAEVLGMVVGNVTRYEFTATGNDAGVAFTRQVTLASPSARVARSSTNYQQVARQARVNAMFARAQARKQKMNVAGLLSTYYETFALYAVASELAGQAETCAATSAPVAKAFTVSGLTTGEGGALGFGPGSAVLSAGQASYSVTVPPGTYDYLAAFGPQPAPLVPGQQWTHYQVGRGEVAPGAPVSINRATATPFATAPFEVTGGAPGSLYTFVQAILSSRGNLISLPLGAPGTSASGTMPFLATGDRRPTDMNLFQANNTAMQGSNDIVNRSATLFLGSGPPAGATPVSLPPAVPNFAMTQSASMPYPVWRTTGSIPTAFQTDVASITAMFEGADESTLTIVSTTRNWLVSQGMAADYFIESPPGLPGYQGIWAATGPLAEGQVTMFGSNITGGVPVPGSITITSFLFKQAP